MQPRLLPLAVIAVWHPGVLYAAPAPPDDLDITLAVERRLAVDDCGQVQAAVENAREAGATSVLNDLRVAY